MTPIVLTGDISFFSPFPKDSASFRREWENPRKSHRRNFWAGKIELRPNTVPCTHSGDWSREMASSFRPAWFYVVRFCLKFPPPKIEEGDSEGQCRSHPVLAAMAFGQMAIKTCLKLLVSKGCLRVTASRVSADSSSYGCQTICVCYLQKRGRWHLRNWFWQCFWSQKAWMLTLRSLGTERSSDSDW